MDQLTAHLLGDVKLNPSGGNVQDLGEVAAAHGVELPEDYVEFINESDGAEGDLGTTWLQLWSVARIIDEAGRKPQHYQDVLLFAGNGANAIYGFDAANASAIIEGDWIGLSRDELIEHGYTFREFLESLQG